MYNYIVANTLLYNYRITKYNYCITIFRQNPIYSIPPRAKISSIMRKQSSPSRAIIKLCRIKIYLWLVAVFGG